MTPWLAVILTVMFAHFAIGPASAEPSAADKGIRFGQAQSAVAICPGMILTASAGKLRADQAAADLQDFDREAGKIRKAWSEAFDCIDLDPETHRFTSCRRTKIASCNAAWSEIGPDGSAIPGLIGFKPEEKSSN